MTTLIQTICLLALIISSSNAYTFLVFEMEWPATNCRQKTCTQSNSGSFDGKNFNIHGLWPSGEPNDDCQYQSNCTTEELDYNQIDQSDVNYMDVYWNSFYNDTPSFRVHEWEKHGTCFDGPMNLFYSSVTQIHKKYNPVSAMAKRNIYPNNNKTYSVSFIKQAIENDFQGPVILKCASIKGVQYLQKVDLFLSYDMTTLTEAPCDKSYSGQCNPQKPVVFPQY